MNDTLMCHTVSASTKNNASKFSYNSIQGHHHSLFEISYYADKLKLRWAMSAGCLQDPNGISARYAAPSVLKRAILGCGIIQSEAGNILVIPDMHLPYHHRDSFDFVHAAFKAYKCKKVINTGDIFDHHQGSYHESEPDALDPETEFKLTRQHAAVLQKMFPVMDISRGNHDAIPSRKLKTVGLPSSMLADENKLYDLKPTWKWHSEYYFNSGGGRPALIPMTLTKRGRWDKKIPK
jgi:hypothetical protein